MSTQEPARTDWSSETMALLGQHPSPPVPYPADTASAAVDYYKRELMSQRLKAVLCRCRSSHEIEREMWDDFEIHRRSAAGYLDQYLDCRQQVCSQDARPAHEINEHGAGASSTHTLDVAARAPRATQASLTREELRLKILRDSLARDLLAICETLAFIRSGPEPPPSKIPPLVSGGCLTSATIGSCILWFNSYRGGAIACASAALIGTALFYSSKTRSLLRTLSIKQGQTDIETLYFLLQEDKLRDRDRGALGTLRFQILDYFRE